MKKFKKIIVMSLVCVLTLSLLCCGVSADVKSKDITLDNYEEIIFDEIERISGYNTDNAEIIELNNTNILTKSVAIEKAVKVTTDEGIVIIVPKIAENDEIVNSFDYTRNKLMTRDLDFQVTHLVDVVINMSCLYNQTYNWSELIGLYTPKGMYFSWTSNNSTASVRDILIKFDANGDYWKINPLTDMGYDRYVSFDIYEVNPTEGVVYGDNAAAMDNNYGLVFTDYFNHGGNISYSINYTVNGVTRYDDYSWIPFGK